MSEAQEKLASIEVEGVSGGGLIKVVSNAKGEIKRIESENEDISRFKPLIKLYDRADIINDIA